MLLDIAIKTYQEKLPELLAHEGKYVVIGKSEVAGVYDTHSDAVQAGYDRFGLEPFLVKQIQAVERVHFISVGPCRT